MYLGFDLGTSGLRTILVSEGGEILGSEEAHYEVSHPHSGWSEQDPAAWIAACQKTLNALRAANPAAVTAIRGIGISGHMHGATLVDKNGDVLRPCMLWNDTRSAQEAAKMDGTDGFRALSGNIVFPGFTAPKVAWVAKHEPEIFAQIHKVLLPKDYLRYWLTGEYFGDMSDAAGTSWLDVGKRAWSAELLEKSGMRRDQMPDLVEGSEAAGMLRSSLASDWGIEGPVTVVGGGGDNAVAACGVGCFSEGDGFVSLGTSGVILAAKECFSPKPESAVHTFCHAIPNTWYQMGVILAATDCMNWLSKNLGPTPAELSGLLGPTISGPSDIRFLPYLSGERTPHNDSRIRASLIGMDVGTGHAELTQAVMEGVGFALRDNLEALKSTGTDLKRVLAIGGGAASEYWVEMLATLLDMPIDLPEAGDFGAALGAARLAIVGVTGADPKDVMTGPKVAKTVSPRSEFSDAYSEAYEEYRALYPAIKAIKK
ncbi:xylulokinase [Falsihalocynthiibacter arcticus]|uniref:Xylulose kinase n=1 Tax=Falsihalocynthiibacter arcticus TaxID=1579316 RepID=A0A126UWD1_9RHOB|nr:xylulokinase [Falsihalocynthiibacter arcticus]AML50382.1 xylulose kinase [Falsihalocynthiibacter arcticus]